MKNAIKQVLPVIVFMLVLAGLFCAGVWSTSQGRRQQAAALMSQAQSLALADITVSSRVGRVIGVSILRQTYDRHRSHGSFDSCFDITGETGVVTVHACAILDSSTGFTWRFNRLTAKSDATGELISIIDH